MNHVNKPLLTLLTFLFVGMGALWASGTRDDYANSYLTIESLEDNDTIMFYIPASITPEQMTSVSYSTDGTEWTTVMIDGTEHRITHILNQGDKVYFKGLGRQCGMYGSTSVVNIYGTAGHVVYGNIMSLLYGDDFASQTAFPEGTDNNFKGLFYYDLYLYSAENLVLPVTTLPGGCYYCMFRECIRLVTPPALPATTLGELCYGNMFDYCYALTEAPALPATTMAFESYFMMFRCCYALTEAPALPATTLAYACYGSMFEGCTSLTTPPELPATTLDEFCYYNMFNDCGALTTVPELPATTLAFGCYAGMFCNCASLATAPELPATVLADECYNSMFEGCTSLTKAPALPANELTPYCYYMMFFGCISLDEVTCLATDISAAGCVDQWMDQVAPSGTFYKAPGMDAWPLNSSSGIPIGWTVAEYDGLDEPQALPAVYPNPVADKLHITGTDIQSVRLFDPQGRLVHTEACGPADQIDLDFQGYARGVYTVSILSKGKTLTRKVVVE